MHYALTLLGLAAPACFGGVFGLRKRLRSARCHRRPVAGSVRCFAHRHARRGNRFSAGGRQRRSDHHRQATGGFGAALRQGSRLPQSTASNQLCEHPFYNDTIFHHVERGSMLVAAATMMRGQPAWTPIFNESRNGLSNRKGTVAMIRDPNRRTGDDPVFHQPR
jgi:hypothetical protein